MVFEGSKKTCTWDDDDSVNDHDQTKFLTDIDTIHSTISLVGDIETCKNDAFSQDKKI